MRILLPTGRATYDTVLEAAAGFDADVVVTGEIASFLTTGTLRALIQKGNYDIVIVSGMVTASFQQVEEETGIPIFIGPRHAADLGMVLALLDTMQLSRSVPADEYISSVKREEAIHKIDGIEQAASYDYIVRGVRIGGSSRIKVLAEIMDAHLREDLRSVVEQFSRSGADIVDLGFGFDATPADIKRCFLLLEDLPCPLAIDTQDPSLIEAGLFRADIVLSLHEGNIPVIGKQVADAGIAAVVVPCMKTLDENIRLAEECGITCIIADPLLQPVGSGLVKSLSGFPEKCKYPVFFGAGNVTELLDADSVGMNALLAGMARETGASLIFTSENSDKTRGSVREMRTATGMMVLAADRPYPKDLGMDLLILKEKRKRREPPVSYNSVVCACPPEGELRYDPRGNFRIGIENDEIVAVINGRAVKSRSWIDLFSTILRNGDVTLLDHAAYLGKELFKAELSIRFGRSYEQDGEF
jgi:dihydropteroate synthase-like protein